MHESPFASFRFFFLFLSNECISQFSEHAHWPTESGGFQWQCILVCAQVRNFLCVLPGWLLLLVLVLLLLSKGNNENCMFWYSIRQSNDMHELWAERSMHCAYTGRLIRQVVLVWTNVVVNTWWIALVKVWLASNGLHFGGFLRFHLFSVEVTHLLAFVFLAVFRLDSDTANHQSSIKNRPCNNFMQFASTRYRKTQNIYRNHTDMNHMSDIIYRKLLARCICSMFWSWCHEKSCRLIVWLCGVDHIHPFA